MKRVYRTVIWISILGIFVFVYYYFGFFQYLLLNILLLNLVAYVSRAILIDVFQSLIKNLLVRYMIMLIINIIWIIFLFSSVLIINDNTINTVIVAIISFLVVAIALTFQNIINNIASGIMLISSEGFEVGDLVQTNGIEGMIKEITLNNLKLQDFDGSITYIPNKNAFNSSVVRYTHKPIQKEKKFEILEVVKRAGKIISGEKKITRYIKVVELLGSVDPEKLDELLAPIFAKYEPIFGVRPYYYANTTVSGVINRLSITIQIITEDPKLILTYLDPLMKDILFKIYEKEINYGWSANDKNNL